MDLFTYLLKKKGHNSSVNGDLFSYLLASRKRGTYQTYTGTQINVNDSINARMKNWILGGNTNQNGTPTPDAPIDIHNVIGENNVIENSGKNLYEPIASTINLNGLTPKLENDGSISASGTITSTFSNICADTEIYLQPGTYTYSLSKTYTHRCNIRAYTNKEKTEWETLEITTGQTKVTKTFTQKIYGWRFYITGLTANTEVNENYKIQVEVGSTATPFEKYKGKNYKVSLSSKNMFKPYSTGQLTAHDVTIDISNNNEITLNGKANAWTWFEIYKNFSIGTYPQTTPVLPLNNENITISNVYVSGSIKNATPYTSLQYKASGDNILSTNLTQEKLSKTAISTGLYRLYVVIPPNCEFDNYKFKIQIETGSEATPYVPYMTPIELCKIGDYQDKIYKSNDKWYLEKNIGKIVLDGTTNLVDIYNHYNDFERVGIIANNLKMSAWSIVQNQDYIYCDKLSNIGSVSNPQVNTILSWNRENKIFMFFPPNTFSSLVEANNYLTTHNTTIYYVYLTPTITEINDDNLINQLEELAKARSFDEQTNISQLSEQLPFDLTVDIKTL